MFFYNVIIAIQVTNGVFKYFTRIPRNLWGLIFADVGNYDAVNFIFCCKFLSDYFRPTDWTKFLIWGAVFGSHNSENKQIKFCGGNEIAKETYDFFALKLSDEYDPPCRNCVWFTASEFDMGHLSLCSYCFFDKYAIKVEEMVGYIRSVLKPVGISLSTGFVTYIMDKMNVDICDEYFYEGNLGTFVMRSEANRVYAFAEKIRDTIIEKFPEHCKRRTELKRKRVEEGVKVMTQRTTKIQLFMGEQKYISEKNKKKKKRVN